MLNPRSLAPTLLCVACAVDWGPLGCASQGYGPYPGDTSTSASIHEGLSCNSLPVGVANDVPIVAELQHYSVSCDSDGSGWCGTRGSCFAKTTLVPVAVEPLALDGVSGITCYDAKYGRLPSCDATATYANGVLTLSKPTPGAVEITMRVADPSYADAEQFLVFTFSTTPGCYVDAGAGDASDATAADGASESADATSDSAIQDAGANDADASDADPADR